MILKIFTRGAYHESRGGLRPDRFGLDYAIAFAPALAPGDDTVAGQGVSAAGALPTRPAREVPWGATRVDRKAGERWNTR